uniref:Histone-lysine N-methyltransferase SETMAR n=1 Tax=Caenorhabditis tropicalis TaxID=1561998 RepID=A0A1I7T6I4_9PELO
MFYYETVKFWFKRFKEGSYNLEDNARSGRPRLNVEDDIDEELEKQAKSSVREVASSLGLNKDTVHRRLRQNLAPTDYHSFHSLQDHLCGKMFDDRSHLEIYLDDFFSGQPTEFYARGIQQLPTRWQYVVDHNGEYIDY